ncbi:unnamed protein product [Rotaria sordida]|uniref:Uncharacterized protein n=1 Tax=Rotaria sordida TaxID=392033 RepID=A0A814XFP6_9BILA|nr:unnamed protein product [Rotaria sordida]CAF1061664.1 unnamed protein product [Rotaria sordida]CAF1214426.1 unnamed protein product [Rotaria sordida]CAF3631663.1 unnamed protein product [Rotaria sordida]CAF3820420.1 unnamed protein product [Rotaria sordida]
MNIFQICTNSSLSKSCQWIFSAQLNNPLLEAINMVYPIIVASLSIVCICISFIGLLLGSWYIEQCACNSGSRRLLALTLFTTLCSLLFSIIVWAMMLTINAQQELFEHSDIHLKNFGYSLWINLGSLSVYLYAFLMYLVAICKN